MTDELRSFHPKLYDAVEMYTKRATLIDEASVKRLVRRVLGKAGVYTFMPPARAYGKAGISDILAVKHGMLVAIETKYGNNTPTGNQDAFGGEIEEHGGIYVVINEKNVTDRVFSVLRWFETGIWDGPRRL